MQRFRPQISDALLFMSVSAGACAALRVDIHYGWIVSIVLLTTYLHYLANHRCYPRFAAASIAILPIVSVLMFCLAFIMAMPHPPAILFWSTIYPPGYTWPEIDTLSARAFHAALLATWGFIYGMPVLVVCGMHQRWYDLCYGIRQEPPKSRHAMEFEEGE